MSFEDSFNDNAEDYTNVFDEIDKEEKAKKKFKETYTQLPFDAYAERDNAMYKFKGAKKISCIFKNSFSLVCECVNGCGWKKVSELADKIDIRDREISEEGATMLIDDKTSTSVVLDTLGYYYYGDSPRPEYTRFKCEWLSRLEYNGGPQIIIDSGKIFGKENDVQKQAFLMAVVVLHELMHAVLDPMNYDQKDEMYHNLLYRHMKEEAWANALTLMAIKSAGKDELLDYAIRFTKTQPKECGYQYGIKLFNDNANNWEEWIEEKAGWSGNDPEKEKQFIEDAKKFQP